MSSSCDLAILSLRFPLSSLSPEGSTIRPLVEADGVCSNLLWLSRTLVISVIKSTNFWSYSSTFLLRSMIFVSCSVMRLFWSLINLFCWTIFCSCSRFFLRCSVSLFLQSCMSLRELSRLALQTRSWCWSFITSWRKEGIRVEGSPKDDDTPWACNPEGPGKKQNDISNEGLTTVIRYITLMVLVANSAITNSYRNPEKWLKPWHMGTYLRVLSMNYLMNTNMTGIRWFSSLCFWTKVASALEGLTDANKFYLQLQGNVTYNLKGHIDRQIFKPFLNRMLFKKINININ